MVTATIGGFPVEDYAADVGAAAQIHINPFGVIKVTAPACGGVVIHGAGCGEATFC